MWASCNSVVVINNISEIFHFLSAVIKVGRLSDVFLVMTPAFPSSVKIRCGLWDSLSDVAEEWAWKEFCFCCYYNKNPLALKHRLTLTRVDINGIISVRKQPLRTDWYRLKVKSYASMSLVVLEHEVTQMTPPCYCLIINVLVIGG